MFFAGNRRQKYRVSLSFALGLLLAISLVLSACGPTLSMSRYIEGTQPLVPFPFIGDTLPRILVTPRISLTNEGEIAGYVSKDQYFPPEYLSWKLPQVVAGVNTEIYLLPQVSLVAGGDFGEKSLRLSAGFSNRDRLWIIRWRGDLGVSYARRYSKTDVQSSDGSKEVSERTRLQPGTYFAGSIWFDDRLTPLVQVSWRNEEVLNKHEGFPVPFINRGILGIATAFAGRVGPNFQWLLGYQTDRIIGLLEPRAAGYFFFQLHFGW